MPACDQVVHLAVEEGQQQRADVRAVDVGVGHDDDLAVAALGEVHLVADARADGRDHAADFFVGQHLVFARLVGVDDLAAQGEDGLVFADAAAFGAAAGRIALDQVQLAASRRRGWCNRGACRAGRRRTGRPCARGPGPWPCGPLSRASAASRPFCTIDLGRLGVLFQIVGQEIADRRVDDALRPRRCPAWSWSAPSNCGSGTRSEMTAVRPSRKSSPRGHQVLEEVRPSCRRR